VPCALAMSGSILTRAAGVETVPEGTEPAHVTAVHRVSTAGYRATADRAPPGHTAIPQRLQPFPVPPDRCLGTAKLTDPHVEVMPVSQPRQLSQARFRPHLAVKPAQGKHGLVHEINHRPPLTATTPLHETNISVSEEAVTVTAGFPPEDSGDVADAASRPVSTSDLGSSPRCRRPPRADRSSRDRRGRGLPTNGESSKAAWDSDQCAERRLQCEP
jgi:hypothetical protein